MREVEITQTVRVNLTGYDREAVTLEPGRHTLPDRVADWIRRNSSVGRVIEAEPERQAAAVGAGDTGDSPEAAPDADAETLDADGSGEAGTEGGGADAGDASNEPVEAAPTRRRTTRRKE